MSETNHVSREPQFGDIVGNAIKLELEVPVRVKPEPSDNSIAECAVCAASSAQCSPLVAATTAAGTPFADYLGKFTRTDLLVDGFSHVCRDCSDLVDVLEAAELEYFKLKETFEEIIGRNPLLAPPVRAPPDVKCESRAADSDSEPLAVTRARRGAARGKRRGRPPTKKKAKPKITKKERWKRGTQPLTVPMVATELSLESVKIENSIEDSDGSQCYNGWDTELKVEIEDESPYLPSQDEEPKRSMLVPVASTSRNKRAKQKVLHKCDQCDFTYTTLRRLQRHRDSQHASGRQPYICEVCGAKYKHKRACDIHVQLHSGISDWKCEECNKLFPSKAALGRHNNIHTGKLNYQCDLCGKSFIHTSSFKMHKLSHSGVKPHACDVCGLRLMTRSHLKRHARVHSGEKRYECAVCGKRFSERYNLLAHAKSHEESPSAVVAATPPVPRRRLFRCAFCPERFERRYMLERHCNVAHGRPLERAPPTPRNTMSKLLKAQAAAAARPPDKDGQTRTDADAHVDVKPQAAAAGAAGDVTTWAGAFQAEFNLRAYSH